MSDHVQQQLEEQWYEEGLKIAEIKGYNELLWDSHAEKYVKMMRSM
tara:strand:- start:35 stop:172 length:138 start_codon:yes stop_codon:yes gene_type:complete